MSHCSSVGSTSTQQDVLVKEHLDWTWKQGRILTCNNKANDFFKAERGFPFDETDLPHHYLLKNTPHSTFEQWIIEQQRRRHGTTGTSHSITSPNDIVCGAWKRLLFVGGFEHVSSSDKEHCWNLQSSCGFFIDLRIPRSREVVLSSAKGRGVTCLQDYTLDELRFFARQHVFGGFTKIGKSLPSDSRGYDIVCTRHHCMDWNFIGIGRPRPNKWYVEPTTSNVGRMFKEWSYATDDHGQSYYFETWQDFSDNNNHIVLALRKAPLSSSQDSHSREDGLLVVVGTHFNYLLGRHHGWQTSVKQIWNLLDKKPTSLVDLVDAALSSSDTVSRSLVEQLLDIDAGHGRILPSSSKQTHNQWKIDCSIQPWNEGTCLFSCDRNEATLMVPRTSTTTMCLDNTSINSCYLMWNNERWNFYECRGIDCPQALAKYFGITLKYYDKSAASVDAATGKSTTTAKTRSKL